MNRLGLNGRTPSTWWLIRVEGVERLRAHLRARRARHRHARRARELAGGTFTTVEWFDLVERYGGRCAYCGDRPERLHVEHMVPLSRGGSNAIDNIVPACARCNFAKHTSTAEEFAEVNGSVSTAFFRGQPITNAHGDTGDRRE